MFKNVVKKELVVPATMAYLKAIRDFIAEIGHAHHFSDKVINSFKLVIDEACTNIIRHGYRDVPDGKITIRAFVRRFSLTIVVVDQGVTFDPRQAKNPDLRKYIDIGKKGGLGILMMRKLMDDIQYSLTPEGNELRLTKKRDQFSANRLAMIWDNLSMQARFTTIASIVTIILGISALFTYTVNSEFEVKSNILNTAAVKTQDYAALSYEALLRSNNLQAFAISRTMYENSPDMVNDAFLVDTDSLVIAFSLSKSTVQKIGRYTFNDNIAPIDTINDVAIRKISLQDSLIVYDLSYAVLSEEKGSQGELLATAHMWITEDFISDQQLKSNIKGIVIISGIILVVITLLMFLIKRIINPFSQLADWVRRVGSGKVDQDEYDIDSTDELGEIAQAFSEMTTKFREAQVGLIEQQRLQKELQVAQEIQHMLLPQDFPQVKGYELASFYEAAKEVGGDLFDFVDVDDNTIGICVADVSGKGVPGSMIMTMIRTALRLEARGNKNAADVLARVNRFVTSDMRKGMFVTIFYIILDSRNRVVSYASAGHNPMVLYRASTQQTYYLNPQGFPVGISLPDIRLFDTTVENDRINLRSDDILVIITDGVTEAMNSNRELFGDERFLEVIRENGHLPVQDFVRNVRDTLRQFAGGYQQNDDITIVAVKEKMSAEEVRVDIQKQLFEMIDEQNVPISQACEKLGVSPFTYYKYRPIVDKFGFEGLVKRLQKKDDIELRHLSIEIKAKIFDIIRNNPEAASEDIRNELNTDKYGFVSAEIAVIDEELKRLKLDTVEKRKKFINKSKDKKHFKTPGTPLLTLDGQVIKDYQGTDTFSPIYQPKKRVFGNIEDQQPGTDGRVITRQASPTDIDSVVEEVQAEEEAPAVDEKSISQPSEANVEVASESDKFAPEVKKEAPGETAEHEKAEIDFESELISEVEDLQPEDVFEEQENTGQAEPAAETLADNPIEEKDDTGLDFLEEEIEPEKVQANRLLNEFEDDKTEREDIKLLQTDASLADNEISESEASVKKAVKRIKTYSELDSESKLTYVNFYNSEKERIDKLDLLIIDEEESGQHFKAVSEYITYFVNEYSTEKSLKRLIQLFKQVNEIIIEIGQKTVKLSEEDQALQRECLKFVSKKNILAEDVIKIRLLNEIGIIRNKLDKKSGHYSRQRLKRRQGSQIQGRRPIVQQRKNVS